MNATDIRGNLGSNSFIYGATPEEASRHETPCQKSSFLPIFQLSEVEDTQKLCRIVRLARTPVSVMQDSHEVAIVMTPGQFEHLLFEKSVFEIGLYSG